MLTQRNRNHLFRLGLLYVGHDGLWFGDEGGLFLDSGEYDMDIPGFKEWNARWGDSDIKAPNYESWWQEGWRIVKEIRKRLPLSIDLYYMCFDPAEPDSHPDYKARLPKYIVPGLAGSD